MSGRTKAANRNVALVSLDVVRERLFDYAVPAELVPSLRPGMRVRVPFGSRVCSGYVIECRAGAAFAAESGKPEQKDLFGEPDAAQPGRLRHIIAIEDPKPFFSDRLLQLLRWLSDYYCAPLEAALRSALPAPVREGGARAKEQLFVEVSPLAMVMLEDGHGGSKTAIPARCDADKISDTNSASKVGTDLRAVRGAPGGRGPTFEMPCREIAGKPKLSARQHELLREIAGCKGGLLNVVCRELKCTPETLRRLQGMGLLVIEPRQIRRDPLANRTILPSSPLPLMPQQEAALRLIVEGMGFTASEARGEQCPVSSVQCSEAVSRMEFTDSGGGSTVVESAIGNGMNNGARQIPVAAAARAPLPVLLYGVTGSGKTEVYLQAIAHALERGGGAIVLVPEIALTPQTVRRFAGRFGDKVAVLHSALSEGERFDEWHRIRDGVARVVVGPRSAVFAPVANLALIVVDEEHEPSYKQEESPRYNARDVAVMRGWIEGCSVVLGSATPAMESWQNVRRGKYLMARLECRAEERPMPTVEIIDMRLDGTRDGKPQIFSRRLIDAVEGRLAAGEQVILFLNRRGYATSLQCTKCGYVAECDSCSVAFTYHRTDERLRCHICGAAHPVPPACPGCGDPGFRYAGVGTQRIETIAQSCFPRARIARLDADATTRKHSHDDILDDFRSGKTDILIGTQMIAKGHHFPNVTLVGVLMADAGLHLPDYRAGERTFQLLAQVSGRSGRGEIPGHVIVQTHTPDHPAIEAARTADFERFAAQELELRREAWLPPFSHVLCLTFKGPDEEKVAFAATAFCRALQSLLPRGTECPEPMPSPLARAKGHYRYQMLVRAGSVRVVACPLRQALQAAPPPSGVSLAVDVDALSVM